MFFARVLVFSTIGLIAMSCGGGGGGGGGSTPNSPPVQTSTGIFVDAPVAGLSYSTDSQSGVTNAAGEFLYVDGEVVRFEYGGVQLGEAPGQGILTPLDILPDDHDSQVALMSFLQSLDMDSDLTNGIELTSLSAAELRDYVNERPQANTFPSIIARDDYASLVGRLTNRATWIGETEALQTFEAEIAPLVAQGLYVAPTPPVQTPDPDPDPDPDPTPPPGSGIPAGWVFPANIRGGNENHVCPGWDTVLYGILDPADGTDVTIQSRPGTTDDLAHMGWEFVGGQPNNDHSICISTDSPNNVPGDFDIYSRNWWINSLNLNGDVYIHNGPTVWHDLAQPQNVIAMPGSGHVVINGVFYLDGVRVQ